MKPKKRVKSSAKQKAIQKELEDQRKIVKAGSIITVVVTIIIFAMAYNSIKQMNETFSDDQTQAKSINPKDVDEIIDPEIAAKIQVTSDGTKFLTDPNEIRSGGPPKGGIGHDRGIPALAAENIDFVSVEEADEWIQDNELVLALQYKGVTRVYPLQIMVWHELANDVVAGDPILITYCPLCGSGIAFERTTVIDGERVENRFGTSGKLYNSNLIMYDELTDTYWQQIGGLAIVGDLTGQELIGIDLDTVVWRDWKAEHPESEVLSQNTGMRRSYGTDPYGSYYEDSLLFFPVDQQDSRIHPKDVIFGIEIDNQYAAYREVDLIEQGTITDVLNGQNIQLVRNPAGDIDITNTDTGETIVKERDFWFSWYAFHPETKLYGFD